VSKLGEKDSEYMSALDEYNLQLAKREELSPDRLLLRLNSACYVEQVLNGLLKTTSSTYGDILANFKMDRDQEIGALEGSLTEGMSVRSLFCPQFSMLVVLSEGRINVRTCLHCVRCSFRWSSVVL
jgi:hypothetical protein